MSNLKVWWEAKLPDHPDWKSIGKLAPHSLVKLMAYSSENNHYQAWEMYVMRPYENYACVLKQIKIPEMHTHSNAVEWQVLKDGMVQVRKKAYSTPRVVVVMEPIVLRGEIKKL